MAKAEGWTLKLTTWQELGGFCLEQENGDTRPASFAFLLFLLLFPANPDALIRVLPRISWNPLVCVQAPSGPPSKTRNPPRHCPHPLWPPGTSHHRCCLSFPISMDSPASSKHFRGISNATKLKLCLQLPSDRALKKRGYLLVFPNDLKAASTRDLECRVLNPHPTKGMKELSAGVPGLGNHSSFCVVN